jgi:cyclophilin family peptidyl-prolyl cis-trans isomerase
MRRSAPLAVLLAVASLSAALFVSHLATADEGKAPKKGAKKAAPKANPRAVIKTSMGSITIELFQDAAPETVRIFLGLAHGTGTFTDVRNNKPVTVSKPFYDGLGFHRVISGFMLQGGCPSGNGTGNPGFMFKDEIDAEALGLHKQTVIQAGKVHPWVAGLGQQYWRQSVLMPVIQKLKMDPAKLSSSRELQQKMQGALETMTLKELYELQGYSYTKGLASRKPVKGSLALANAGPNTNGSQFFINLGPTPHLTGRHTVFAQVVGGMDVVEAIGRVPVNKMAGNKPIKPVTIISIRKAP